MRKKNKGRPASDVAKENKSKLAQLELQVNNLNSHAMDQLRQDRQQGQLIEMMATCLTLVIKDVVGIGLTDEEMAALREALGKGESDGVAAPQQPDGKAAPNDGESSGTVEPAANPE